jgi:hypothetical protein
MCTLILCIVYAFKTEVGELHTVRWPEAARDDVQLLQYIPILVLENIVTTKINK